MAPEVYGKEHIIYLVLSTLVGALSVILLKKYAKTEKAQTIALKTVAFLLFASILANRLSQVFRYGQVRWYCIIPDSYCGMTSLVIAIAVLIGKRDNPALHFAWLLGLFGGISTSLYPTYVSQDISFFYLPTFSGLLHHSFCALTVVLLIAFKQIEVTYKKWHYVIFGFTCYISVGAFLMGVFEVSDAFHIVEPLLPNTSLTTWVMAPIYLVCYGVILAVIEAVRKHKNKDGKLNEN